MATLTSRPSSWISAAPIQIHRSALVEASPDVVWGYFADDEGWPEWFTSLKLCTFTSAPPHGVGSTRVVHQDQFKVREEITAWEPNVLWAMTVTEINAPVLVSMAEQARFEPQGKATRINFSIGVELTRFGKLLSRPLIAKTTKSLETGLSNLNMHIKQTVL